LEKHVVGNTARVESTQEANWDGWPAWQEVRQSKRIKGAGVSHLKLGGKDQSKLSKDLETEGNSSLQQNSFAVISNPHIISLASMMGISSDSIFFEKIDLLKDLENARMKLNDHATVVVEQPVNLEGDTLPLNDHNVLDWGYEESEEEPMIVINSIRKSRSSKKYKRKTRAIRNPPLEESVNSKGGKSKVSPRFNLRDRNTIKKVIK
jgi:hypothetical protein